MEEKISLQNIPKLKLLKLNSLLTSENDKQKIFMKTERLQPKYNSRISIIRNPTQPINTDSKKIIHKSSNQKLKENYKKKFKTIYSNTPLLLPLLSIENKKKKNNFNNNNNSNSKNICSLNSIEGYNSYLKEKTNKEYMKINRMLMEQTLYRLSLPKFRRAKRQTFKKEKTKASDNNDNRYFEDYFDVDMGEKDEKLKIEKRHKNKINKSLYEKERIKCREKFTLLMKNNFKKLEACEKKFDKVIDKTLKLLSDYKMSLSYLKNENN